MEISINVECDTISELLAHLKVMQQELRRYAKKQNLSLDDYLPEDAVFEDNNCYGFHRLYRIVREQEF